MFSVNPESPAAGSTAVFDATASRTDPGTVISSYAWDFGDGRQVNTSSPTIEHSFGAPGRYPVTLRVSGGLIAGGTDTYTLVVVVR
jgi:PKD repeat protein